MLSMLSSTLKKKKMNKTIKRLLIDTKSIKTKILNIIKMLETKQ